MASHVTYDGVTGAGGNIFRDIKFWVSLNVPQRSSIIEKIESNGGVVVPREKDADMLIADHVKKNAPMGSYSWKFITESVNAGILQVEDKYIKEPPPNERRSILAGPHARKTRMQFTEFDDALVAKYVLKEGTNTAGNAMYMKLADQVCPRHLPPPKTCIRGQTNRKMIAKADKRRLRGSWEAKRETKTFRTMLVDQFLSDLRDYCEANNKRLHTRCVVEDHEVDLFDLYQAVSAQSVPLDEVDWKQVAQDVGLGRTRSKAVTAGLLESSYNRYLGDFAEAMMSFEDIEEDPDEDIAEEDGAAFGDEEAATHSTTPRPSQQNHILSSMMSDPSEMRLSKRVSDERPSTPEKAPKRRRTMHTEIPMTPEDKLRTTGRPSAPSSAPGNLYRIIDEEPAETEEPSQRTHRQQPPLDESFDMTPSQQLRSETDLVANTEHAETPTLYFSPTAARLAQRNDGRLETIPEEVPSTYTPTRSRSKKRALPPSFGQAQQPPSRELRERQLKEELERLRRQQQQQQQEDVQQQDAVDSSDPDEEHVEDKKKQFNRCKENYLRQGYTEVEVLEAMRRTTMTPGETMDIVLKSLRAKRGIPENYEGIWTDGDDSQLKYVVRVGGLEGMPGDGAEMRHRKEKAQKMLNRLLYKHGEANVKLRKKFLRELALAQREMERGLQA
ncbi:hypothetical protein BBK36DRAFT_1123694 [Trichoderma citrinoviride]|uniref:DNA-binding protein RAP1 n=1 Tax=Trichoderma citrinoviride TaxID=58853 RepID=A0A2T4B5I8_9HYPO|nr:hypothetical protein BBK36DRAFT_1123694 [Trichoderma citrinoviride]PTB64595.1 hypothetical protein BBK36DRAFT_1123694 [Trichoderma citrinoviride]